MNLKRNLLGDAGVIIIVKAFKSSTCLISLDVSSNEVKPKGICKVFEHLIGNQSIQELVLGSEDGGILNRVNSNVHDYLEKFVV